jgi:hypothetical protein
MIMAIQQILSKTDQYSNLFIKYKNKLAVNNKISQNQSKGSCEGLQMKFTEPKQRKQRFEYPATAIII